MNERWLAACLALLALLAGCSVSLPASDGDGAATAGGGPLTPAGGEQVTMTVTRVVDGDTMNVRFDNGIEDTVRLLGVDTPETRSENMPKEWEGVPDTAAGRECLSRYGDRATAFATEALDGREVTFYFDPEADRRGSFGRLLGYFVVDGRNVNYRLVREGYARVFDSRFSLSGSFYEAEEDARRAERGAWA
jgi:micrococcal nuclease